MISGPYLAPNSGFMPPQNRLRPVFVFEAMSTVTERKLKLDLTPGKRCSDYDEDCAGVEDHFTCWRGGTFLVACRICETAPADGYCPYLIGQCKS